MPLHEDHGKREHLDVERYAATLAMAAGSILGTVAGGALLGVVPDAVLVPLLALLLLLSARKVWQHG